MYIPLPLLIIGGVIILALLLWALKRGGGGNELSAKQADIRPRERFRTPVVPVTLDRISKEDIPDDLRAELMHLLQRRSKIPAIKLVREHTGLGLKEAKDYIDALSDGHM